MNPPPLLVSAHDVRRAFGPQEVLRGVSLTLAEGEMVALLGRSGSGKSTLLHLIGGLDRGYAGTLQVCGQDLRALSDHGLSRLRNEAIGFVFQSFHLIDAASCQENVLLPNAFSHAPLSRAAALRRADEVLDQVGLLDRRADLPANLSGGQKQRVAIARALFFRPRLLLCDEPTGNLDSHTGAQIIALFRDLHRQGQTLLLITHEERISAAASRVLHLEDGRVVDGGAA
jgi:putative ABC transport system ATP-binding protein